MIKIHDFEVEEDLRETGCPVLASKTGKLFWLTRCPYDMTLSRAREIKEAFNESILPNGNLDLPLFFKEKGIWYCADVYYSSEMDGYNAKVFSALPAVHRQRIVFGSIYALKTLHEAGLVHGSISPDAFRVHISRDGSFRTRLSKFAYAGTEGRRISGYPDGYAAAECGNDYISQKTDTFALGVTIYFWLTGKLPQWTEDKRLILPDFVPTGYYPLLGAMLQFDEKDRIRLRCIDKGRYKDFFLFPLTKYPLISHQALGTENGEYLKQLQRNRINYQPEYVGKMDFKVW